MNNWKKKDQTMETILQLSLPVLSNSLPKTAKNILKIFQN